MSSAESSSDEQKKRQCLICGVPITECHLGIDSCRACSVFYKRTLPLNLNFLKCKQGDGKCITTEPTTNCRKCRFVKFREVLERAETHRREFEDEVDSGVGTSLCSSNAEADAASSFIDHNSFFSCEPSCSDTPFLDKIKRGYSLMCLVRKTSELSSQPAHLLKSIADFEGSNLTFHPATYKFVMASSKVTVSATYDFANSTFDDFRAMSETEKISVILNTLMLFAHVDATYRAAHHFPDDETVFATYTTTFTQESASLFLDGSPVGQHREDVLRYARQNMKRGAFISKATFVRVKPTQMESLALLGLAFWSNELASLNDGMMEIVERNRAAIMKEMHTVYKKQGRSDYATRLGDVLCLLSNLEKNVDIAKEDVEMYRLMNLID